MALSEKRRPKIQCNVGKAVANHTQFDNGWYKPSQYGWFHVVYDQVINPQIIQVIRPRLNFETTIVTWGFSILRTL